MMVAMVTENEANQTSKYQALKLDKRQHVGNIDIEMTIDNGQLKKNYLGNRHRPNASRYSRVSREIDILEVFLDAMLQFL